MPSLPVRILIVDDEEENLNFYEQVLTAELFTIVKARDGIEALDRFEKFQPDIVLTDLMMPRLNGFEVCTRLKSHPVTRAVPIILLTAWDDKEAQTLALKSGADAFLSKPVAPHLLLATIQRLIPAQRLSS